MAKLRILIAEDDPLMRAFVAVCLQDIADVRHACDGAEAMQELESFDFDLLLLDWGMPAPDGLTVLKTIRAKGFRLPVIMVTAEAGKARVLEAIRAGANDYLIKPFDAAALREKVVKSSLSKGKANRSPVRVQAIPGEMVTAQIKFFCPRNQSDKIAVEMEFEVREGKRTAASDRTAENPRLEEHTADR